MFDPCAVDLDERTRWSTVPLGTLGPVAPDDDFQRDFWFSETGDGALVDPFQGRVVPSQPFHNDRPLWLCERNLFDGSNPHRQSPCRKPCLRSKKRRTSLSGIISASPDKA